MYLSPLIIKALKSGTLVIPTSNTILHSKYTQTSSTMLICGSIPTVLLYLTDLELNIMAAIFQTTISIHLLVCKLKQFRPFLLNYVTSHFPNQWLSSPTHICVTRSQCIQSIKSSTYAFPCLMPHVRRLYWLPWGQDLFYKQRLTLIPTWISNYIIQCEMKLLIYSLTSAVQLLNFGNG